MSSPVLVMFKYRISLNVSLLFCLWAFFFFFFFLAVPDSLHDLKSLVP